MDCVELSWLFPPLHVISNIVIEVDFHRKSATKCTVTVVKSEHSVSRSSAEQYRESVANSLKLSVLKVPNVNGMAMTRKRTRE